MKNENEEFIAHGVYTISNSIGFEVQISKDGESARLRTWDSEEQGEVTEWLAIEFNDEGEAIIDLDPAGHNIPLSQVMRINNF